MPAVATRGFTLIELMIAVVVVGILAVIALPSYNSYMLRASRLAAKSKLLEIAARQEGYFTDRKQYATALGPGGLGYAGDTLYVTREGQVSTSAGSGAIYKVTLAAYSSSAAANCAATGSASGTAFIVLAEPVSGQIKDSACGKLCVAHDGTRGRSGPSTDCWKG